MGEDEPCLPDRPASVIIATSRPIRALWVMLSVWVSGRAATLWLEAEQGGASRLSVQWRETLPDAHFSGPVALATPAHVIPMVTMRIDAEPSKQSQLPRHMIQIVPPNGPGRYRLTAQTNPPSLRLRTVAVPPQIAIRAPPHNLAPAASKSQASSFSASPASVDAPPEAKSSHDGQRLSSSGWALVRGGGAPGLSGGGQLGGSQIGIRSNFALNSPHSISVTARLTAPLNSETGKEVAVGIALKLVAAVPIQIIAERRIAADHGGRNDFEIIAAGGVYDHPLGRHLTVSAYAQVGVVGITRRDTFADGSIEVEHPVVHEERLTLSVGAGAWGAAQPGVSRLDVGPEISARTQIGPASLKLTASYRFQLAGDARPSSGPALSLGTDF